MDSLASLNIVPFVGLMNLVEVKYLHMPEVYRTMLAILCDYNPLSQDNIVKTRHYLRVLLAREPDLAQCLLNFIDTPEENTENVSHTETCTPATCPKSAAQEVDSSSLAFLDQQGEDSTSGRSCNENDSLIIQPFTTASATRQADLAPGIFHTNLPPDDSSLRPSGNCSPTSTPKNLNYSDRVPHFVPVINIHHRGAVPSEATIIAASAASQSQGVSLFLPHVLSSHGAQSGCNQTTVPFSAAGFNTTTSDDQSSTLLSLLPPDSQTHTKSDSNTYSHVVEKVTIKDGKQWRPAQTQTSARTTPETSTFHTAVSVTAKQMSGPARTSQSVSCASPLSTDTCCSPATSTSLPSSSINTPSVCLSKLLGQPSVAYLPAGHFIHNRNCIVGGCKMSAAERLSYNSTILGDKLSSAAAKLHLLSTQAGSEKTGSFQAGHRKTAATVTAVLGPTSESDQQDGRAKAAVKLTSRSGGCSKLITLSRILPLPNPDAATPEPALASVTTEAVSSDKQVQVGQHHVSKRFKASAGRRDPASQPLPVDKLTAKLTANQRCQALLLGGQHDENLPVVQKKRSQALQPRNEILNESTAKGEHFSVTPKESKKLSTSHQKNPKLRRMPVQKQEIHLIDTPVEGQKKHVKLAQLAATGKDQHKIEHSVCKHESQDWSVRHPESKTVPDDEENVSPQTHTSTAVVSEKHMQLGGKMTTMKSAVGRQKVQVLEVSVGATHSLSAFPYIQQVVLPDGHVSTITHNSALGRTVSGPCQTKPTDAQRTDSVTTSSHTRPISSAIGSQTVQGERRTTQIVLPKNQVKLSVSIQTLTSKLSMAKVKEEKQASSNLTNLGMHPMTPTVASKQKGVEETTLEPQEANPPISVAEKDALVDCSKPGPSTAVVHGKAKRKRPHSTSSNTISAKKLRV